MFAQYWWCIAALSRRFVVAVVAALPLIFAPALYAAEEYPHSVTLSSASGSTVSAQALVDEALRANPGITALEGVLGILPPNTAKTVEGPVFTGLQATINFNLARVSVSSSAFGSKNEQNQATINSHCR